ncbi:hypothetical protein F4679DRAFT_290284 [Xylaria curta]|nr:hypothetical protein F4679DRAFT_290284 [Xylaria curta]
MGNVVTSMCLCEAVLCLMAAISVLGIYAANFKNALFAYASPRHVISHVSETDALVGSCVPECLIPETTLKRKMPRL